MSKKPNAIVVKCPECGVKLVRQKAKDEICQVCQKKVKMQDTKKRVIYTN